MKKRTVALFCAVVMVFGMCAMSIQANATEEQYSVGYAIKDINPWKDPTDPSKGLITHNYGGDVGEQGLKLSGRGANDNERYCVGVWDDNLDGKWYGYYYTDTNKTEKVYGTGYTTADEAAGDGLQTTCVAITDAKGNTVLLISLDALGAFGNLTTDVRAQILKSAKENPAAWGHANVTLDAIIINGSHTHSSLRFSETSIYGNYEGNKTSNVAAKKYYNRVVDQIVAAAKEACQDRAKATMYKSSVDVSEALPATGITNNSGVKNLQLNFVRQYNQYYRATISKLGIQEEGFNVISGSNFGWAEGVQKYMAEKYGVSVADVKVQSVRMEDKDELVSVNGKEAPADDMLHLIEFRFAENLGKDPIAMINWRAHTTENGGDYFGAASSDYVGPLRTLLGKKENGGYRVAFFLGASGNLTINSRMSSGYLLTPWRQPLSKKIWDKVTDNPLYDAQWKSTVHLYADLLKRAALTKLGGKGTEMTDLGDIRVATSTFYAPKQTYSEGWVKAVEDLIAVAAEREIDWKKNSDLYPHRYRHTDGKVYIIASYFHANTINARKNTALGASQGVTLSAVALGNAAAFVAAPYELSDRYYDNLANGDLLDNDWDDLENIIGTGDPFVLSCANNYISYLPGSLEYIYNTQEYYDIFSKNNTVPAYRDYAKDGPLIYGPGNYESHISPLARGAGEMMIDRFEEMLRSLKNNTQTKPTYCDKCQQDVIWQPITNVKIGGIDGGHYYLDENVSRENGSLNIIEVGRTLCLDLRGKTYEANDGVFHLYQNATLNVTDSVGGGKIIAHNVIPSYGAAVITSGNSTLNWYGGTLSCEAIPNTQSPAARTIYSYGVVNVYGGTIQGGKVISGAANANYHDGCGATIYLSSNGKLFVSGGVITSGEAAVKGNGVYLSAGGSQIKLSGTAHIDEIYVSTYKTDNSQLTVNGGTANVVFAPGISLYKNKQLGTGTDGSGLTVNNGQYSVKTSSNRLYLDDPKPDYNEPVSNGATNYTSLGEALKAYNSGIITLKSNITESVVLTKDSYVDLNGYTISGKITVPDGNTLYVMDNLTDDYDIDDGKGYGKITGTITGKVKGAFIPGDNENKNYVKITDNGAVSFHRAFLDLKTVTLQVKGGTYSPSIKYKGMVQGDRLVAGHATQYGVAFSLSGAPTVEKMKEGTYSSFTGLQAGKTDETPGTFVVNIMQPGQGDYINGTNAKTNIYGSAYIVVDGEYYFGETAVRNLRQVVVEADRYYWSDLEEPQRTALVNMYKQFEGNMEYWGLTNIMAAAN